MQKINLKNAINLWVIIFMVLFTGFTFIYNQRVAYAKECGSADQCERAAIRCRDVVGGTWDNEIGRCNGSAGDIGNVNPGSGDNGSGGTGGGPGLLEGVNTKQGKVEEYLQLAVNILTGASAVAIVASVVISGIQYSTSGGNPQAVAKAREKIYGAVIALIASLLLYSFLQWLIPGGPFG